MNRTIKDATVKRYFYETHDQLRTHLRDFVDAYNFGRRLKTLNGLTPLKFVCKRWTTEPERFRVNPLQQVRGLNNYHRGKPKPDQPDWAGAAKGIARSRRKGAERATNAKHILKLPNEGSDKRKFFFAVLYRGDKVARCGKDGDRGGSSGARPPVKTLVVATMALLVSAPSPVFAGWADPRYNPLQRYYRRAQMVDGILRHVTIKFTFE
jgi:hypothetical protein